MKILIIEDEALAARKLERLIGEVIPKAEIVSVLDSVKSSAKWLANSPSPDLIFMDIQLGDGVCFEIFEIVTVDCPVIITTAYNEYASEAFQINSVDYLLKPISRESLSSSYERFQLRQKEFDGAAYQARLKGAQGDLMKGHKRRFMVKVGAHIVSIPVNEIVCLFSRDKGTYIGTKEGRNYLVDYSLEQVEELIDKDSFFRISRKHIVAFEAIKDIVSYSNSRLKVHIDQFDDEDVLVSRHRVSDFKHWLDR